jgi:hypothetical protein
MPGHEEFRPGFRLSEFDVGVLIVGILVSVIVGRSDDWLGLAVAFTVAHFFLFCNVLRMSRSYELIWAALFLLLAASTILQGVPTWSNTFLAMLLCTFVLAGVAIRKPSYHGVCWRIVNPNLPQWWAANTERK